MRKNFLNILTNAYLEYAALVVKLRKYENFDFAVTIVQERIEDSPFPIEKYKAFSIMAIIYSYRDDEERAKHFAILAGKNASAETSGLRYHRYLGIVKDRDDHLDDLVKEIDKNLVE